jgi:hypothetical protein
MTLRVTLVNGVWAFDDPAKNLTREPFVAGADTLCEALAALVGNTDAVTLVFSQFKFPSHQLVLDWLRPDGGGNLYIVKSMAHQVWLCPALLKYFDKPPRQIYVEAKK